MTPEKSLLIGLYKQLYDLTNPLCAQCKCPQSCCSPEYCGMAEERMKEWGEPIPHHTGHRLPFMGEHGCIVPPHLRPICTMHHCAINSLGFFPKDQESTEKYYKIREEIEFIEYETTYNTAQDLPIPKG